MTFYFYDLETSGINARAQRIMQFAGQRTDENFEPIGEPQDWLIKLTEEVLPDPEAVLITGITPQKTLEEGYSEAEFLKLFYEQVLQPDTIICGFNTIRFDDEFMRNTLWRNFYDPYEWQWQDGRSRWDLLDVVRMTRALRPEGIEWPFEERKVEGVNKSKSKSSKTNTVSVPTNRLELLAKVNNISHTNAHDALSDVNATIAVAKLLKNRQPQLFNYLLKMRDKKQVTELVNLDEKKPFIYSSGRYENNFNKTTVAFPITSAPNKNVVVYDLRYDPTPLVNFSEQEIADRVFASWQDRQAEDFVKIPVKILQYNKSPAVAPLGVLTHNNGWEKIKLTEDIIKKHMQTLVKNPDFAERLRSVFERRKDYPNVDDPDFQIYDGFVNEKDKVNMRVARAANSDSLSDLTLEFSDERLEKLLPRYKARNFSRSLNSSERQNWDEYKTKRLVNGVNGQLSLSQFLERLSYLEKHKQDDNGIFLLKELQLYAESIAPLE